MQARKLDLRRHLSSSSASTVSSLLVEPISRSVAAKLSDSSLLIFPPLSLPLSSNLPNPTVVPPISSSACFLCIHSSKSVTGGVVFLACSAQGGGILLRGWILRGGCNFAPVPLGYKTARFDLGILLEHRHGFSVALAGTVNFFVLHSPAEEKIFIYGTKLSGEAEKGEFQVDLMKCAIIECTLPIFSIQLSPTVLLLVEMAGVRVFPLRPLVKGKSGKRKNARSGRKVNSEEFKREKGKKLPNGVTMDISSGKKEDAGTSAASANKLRTSKLKQNSTNTSYFIGFPHADMAPSPPLIKASSIHVLPHRRFLVIDSSGDLHLLTLTESLKDFSLTNLNCPIKMKILATFPPLETRGQIIWISDRLYSVYVILLTEDGESDPKLTHVTAMYSIFSRERIRDIAAIADNAALILEEGEIYLYELT